MRYFGAWCLLPLGCSSSQLSRKQASKIILSNYSVAANSTLFVPYGKESRVGAGKYCDQDLFIPAVVSMALANHWDSTGVLNIREIKPCGDWDVELTDAAKQNLENHAQANDVGSRYATVILAKYKEIKITGVVQDGPHAIADVSLTYELTNLGRTYVKANGSFPANCELSSDRSSINCLNKYPLTRYDDGWRGDHKADFR